MPPSFSGSSIIHHARQFFNDDMEDDQILWLIDELYTKVPVQVSQPSVINHRQHEGHACIYANYFTTEPVYGPQVFEHRFRVTCQLFLAICDKVQAHNIFWVQRLVSFF